MYRLSGKEFLMFLCLQDEMFFSVESIVSGIPESRLNDTITRVPFVSINYHFVEPHQNSIERGQLKCDITNEIFDVQISQGIISCS